MVEVTYEQEEGDDVVVDLRDPYWAALLAWLWPGAGHFYQRRYAKGFLFMICVLSTFFTGWEWEEAAAFMPHSKRTISVGSIYARLAREQSHYLLRPKRWSPPTEVTRFLSSANVMHLVPIIRDATTEMSFTSSRTRITTARPSKMALWPHRQEASTKRRGYTGMWHYEMKHMYDMGTLYCVVAGLLNMLAIYDAFCGPAILTPEEKRKLEEKKKKKKKKKRNRRGEDE